MREAAICGAVVLSPVPPAAPGFVFAVFAVPDCFEPDCFESDDFDADLGVMAISQSVDAPSGDLPPATFDGGVFVAVES